ncbi:MAG: hypothetical protein ACEQSB_08090, partial [Undibacterium sp.]
MTPRNSFIVKGNEYQVANQMIRKPGAYVVRSGKGDAFKGMLALGGERTQNLDIEFDPENNHYDVKIGTAKKALYPLLKSLGATDQELIKAWGEKIFTANKREKPADYTSYAKLLARTTTDNATTAQEAIKEAAKELKVDPEVSKLTLGVGHSQLSRQLVLDTSRKILDVYKGTQPPDDPENLLFKEIRSVEDMVH